jgi:hypothetical protein
VRGRLSVLRPTAGETRGPKSRRTLVRSCLRHHPQDEVNTDWRGASIGEPPRLAEVRT